jgi:hypothetical protein
MAASETLRLWLWRIIFQAPLRLRWSLRLTAMIGCLPSRSHTRLNLFLTLTALHGIQDAFADKKAQSIEQGKEIDDEHRNKANAHRGGNVFLGTRRV